MSKDPAEERKRKHVKLFWSIVEFLFYALCITLGYLALWSIHNWIESLQ